MRTYSLLAFDSGPPLWAILADRLGRQIVKEAAEPVLGPRPAYSLAGTLFLSQAGTLCLSVPNGFVRSIFSAMAEPGVVLPPGPGGVLNAHVEVMSAAEVWAIGEGRLSERGKQYRYTLGRLVAVEQAGGWNKAWMVRIYSPELQALRKSYGLPALPGQGRYDFHVLVAVRPRGVLGRNETSKAETSAETG